MRNDKRRARGGLDHVRHGEGLARARHAEQRLVAVPALQRLRHLLDGARLVPERPVGRHKLELGRGKVAFEDHGSRVRMV